MEKYDITDYLKDDKELQKAVIEEFLKEIAELKAENERLKARVKEIGEKMNFLNADRCSEIMRYKQTLQEIKAIAEKLMADNLCNNCDGIGLDANCQDTDCPYYQMEKILQKITKAEEE